MPQKPPMVLDSNAFIEPKNRFYAFDICPGFWDFVAADFANGNAISIIHVRDEILAGGDELSTWTEQLRVASHVMGACTKPNLVNDFLGPGVADSWVVAYALAYGSTVVTQEIHRSMNRKVSLFDVCDHFGIHHIDVFEFLRAEKARFVYERDSA